MTSSASESAFEQTTYDAVISKTFTRITECPLTRRSVDTLRKEVEHVLVNISVPNFGWSEKYGLPRKLNQMLNIPLSLVD